MKNLLLGILLLASVSVHGAENKLGLFASITGVTKGDVLNVRENADFRSKKMGSFPANYPVPLYVEMCKKLIKSTWCKVRPEALFEGGAMGWVNARYLNFSNQGYVKIQGKENKCFYALKCKDKKCEVVESFKSDEQNEVISIQTVSVDQEKLTPTSHFGAMFKDEDGYCTLGNRVQDFLSKKDMKSLSPSISDESQKKAVELVRALSNLSDTEQITSHIHPSKGVVVTWNVVFGSGVDLAFSRDEIRGMQKQGQEIIHWGQTYGKGDDVFLTLYQHLEKFTRPVADITKIEKLKSNKRFVTEDGVESVAYEVFWINEKSKTKDYDWLGLVMVLEKHEGKWYVVGLLRDRWTV